MKVELFNIESEDREWMLVEDFPSYTFGVFSDNHKSFSKSIWIIYKGEKFIYFIDKQWIGNNRERTDFFATSRIRKLRHGEQIKISGE